MSGIINFILQNTSIARRFLVRDFLQIGSILNGPAAKLDKFLLHSIEKSKELLRQHLEKYPNSKISFSALDIKDAEMVFFISPIEGRINFINQVPMFAMVIIAQHKTQGRSIVIQLPMLNAFYTYCATNISITENNEEQSVKIMSKNVDKTSLLIAVDSLKQEFAEIIISQKSVLQHHVRMFGCISYTIMLLLQNKVDVIIISKSNTIMVHVISTISDCCNIKMVEKNTCYVITNELIVVS